MTRRARHNARPTAPLREPQARSCSSPPREPSSRLAPLRKPQAHAVLLVLLGQLAFAGLAAAESPETLADCDAAVRERPDDRAAYGCYYRVARSTGDFTGARARLDALLAADPSNPYARLVVGNLDSDRDSDAAVASYRAAIAELERRGKDDETVLVRLNLALQLARGGDLQAAELELERADRVAARSGAEDARALVTLERARLIIRSGGALGVAERMLDAAADALLARGPYQARMHYFQARASIASQRDQLDAALAYTERGLEAAQEQGDRYIAASLAYNRLVFRLDLVARQPAPDLAALATEADAVLAATRAADHATAVTAALCLRGDLLAAEADLRECVERARAESDLQRAAHYAATLAVFLRDRGRAEEAQALFAEARAWARESQAPRARLFVELAAVDAGWRHSPLPEARAGALAVLAAIEALTAEERALDDRIPRFGGFTDVYRRVVGELLRHPARQDSDIALAFALSERMRAYSLREQFPNDLPDTPERPTSEPPPASDARPRPDSEPPPASDARPRPDSEPPPASDARPRPDSEPPGPALDAPGLPPAVDLARVRAALEPGEALLVYQLGSDADLQGRFAGGSWLWVVTPARVDLVRLPGRARLAGRLLAYAGSFAARDGSEEPAGAALHDELLAPALARLEDDAHTLIIVPDQELHALPFAALRPAPGEPPVLARHVVAVVPSVTAWLRGRALRTPGDARSPSGTSAAPAASSAPSRVLGFADPPVADADHLPPLPHARAELAAMADALVGRAEVLLHRGDEASEVALRRGLEGAALVHVAAHTRIDTASPAHSAVLLAAAGPGEACDGAACDGALSVSEVLRLDAAGAWIVLAACSADSGPLVPGEGLDGLAHAWLRAGAGGVIATAWPIRDSEARLLFTAFYRALAGGAAVGPALAAAQREALAAGLPAEAWAGVRVLGDPAARPLPAPPAPVAPARWPLAAVALALVCALALLWRWRSTPR